MKPILSLKEVLKEGETTNDIFDTLLSTGTDYAAAVESLTQRFDPSTNKDMEIYEFLHSRIRGNNQRILPSFEGKIEFMRIY